MKLYLLHLYTVCMVSVLQVREVFALSLTLFSFCIEKLIIDKGLW